MRSYVCFRRCYIDSCLFKLLRLVDLGLDALIQLTLMSCGT